MNIAKQAELATLQWWKSPDSFKAKISPFEYCAKYAVMLRNKELEEEAGNASS